MPSSVSLSSRVIQDLLSKNEIDQADLSVDAQKLEREYSLAEAIGAKHVPLDDIDMVVVPSGRSGFKGAYLEAADKYALCPDKFDASDTMRRMAYGIDIARQCTKNNALKNISKPVYVYFNGVKKQNEELRDLLRSKGSLNGYPAHLFIIDPIALDNTLGQVIGLSYYLHKHWPSFSRQWHLSRPPNIVFCTSSYHVPRVALAVGSNSPLLTPAFWYSHPELLEKLPDQMRDYVLNPNDTLKKAQVMVLGCDRQISAHPFWEKDLYGDMQARLNYSTIRRLNNYSVQSSPSIASDAPSNIVTVFKVFSKIALRQSLYENRKWSQKDLLLTEDSDGDTSDTSNSMGAESSL
jgi:hypothetical protein